MRTLTIKARVSRTFDSCGDDPQKLDQIIRETREAPYDIKY
jgi:hypothetical protein